MSGAFPELPGRRDEFETDELRALVELGEELRAACPDPPLADDAVDRIAERAVPVWSLRQSWREQPLLRVAAVLLLALASTVPVAAVIRLLQAPASAPPRIEFQLPEEPRAVDRSVAPMPDLVPLEVPLPESRLDDAWLDALDIENRWLQASHRWHEVFPVRGLARRDLSGLAAGARAGLELRLGWRAAAASPALEDWSTADADQLWAELERRLARGATRPAPAGLRSRLVELWEEPELRAWLAGWRCIHDHDLTGPVAAHPRPGGEGLSVLWEAVLLDGVPCDWHGSPPR